MKKSRKNSKNKSKNKSKTTSRNKSTKNSIKKPKIERNPPSQLKAVIQDWGTLQMSSLFFSSEEGQHFSQMKTSLDLKSSNQVSGSELEMGTETETETETVKRLLKQLKLKIEELSKVVEN